MQSNIFEKTLKCGCCNKEFNVYSIGLYRWKLDGEYFCSYGCYSKKFDKKYTASKVNMNVLSSGNAGKSVKYIKEDNINL